MGMFQGRWVLADNGLTAQDQCRRYLNITLPAGSDFELCVISW